MGHDFVLEDCKPENIIPGKEGKVTDFPLWFKKRMYNCIKQIDIHEIDEILKTPDVGAVVCEEFENMKIIISNDFIIVFINVVFCDMSKEKTEEDKLLTFRIPRDGLENLIKEDK